MCFIVSCVYEYIFPAELHVSNCREKYGYFERMVVDECECVGPTVDSKFN